MKSKILLLNETREIVVLKVFGRQIPSEHDRVPDDVGRSIFISQNHIIHCFIFNQGVGFRQKTTLGAFSVIRRYLDMPAI